MTIMLTRQQTFALGFRRNNARGGRRESGNSIT